MNNKYTKYHWTDNDGQPLCGRVSLACAEITTNPQDVTCKWCMKLIAKAGPS